MPSEPLFTEDDDQVLADALGIAAASRALQDPELEEVHPALEHGITAAAERNNARTGQQQ